MGAPGGAYFCKNGHLLITLAHHEILDEDPKKCFICGCEDIRFDFEWGDTEYDFRVPIIPIKKVPEYVLANNIYIKSRKKYVKAKGEFYHLIYHDIFDVSKLF
jgi:hypothetical protein